MFVRCRNMHSHIKSTSLDLKMRLSYRQMHLSVKRSTPAGFRIGSARAITPWSPRKPRTPRGPPHAEAFLCVFELGSDSALTLGKLWAARSRLYRGRSLQLNTHFLNMFQALQVLYPSAALWTPHFSKMSSNLFTDSLSRDVVLISQTHPSIPRSGDWYVEVGTNFH